MSYLLADINFTALLSIEFIGYKGRKVTPLWKTNTRLISHHIRQQVIKRSWACYDYGRVQSMSNEYYVLHYLIHVVAVLVDVGDFQCGRSHMELGGTEDVALSRVRCAATKATSTAEATLAVRHVTGCSRVRSSRSRCGRIGHRTSHAISMVITKAFAANRSSRST
jgi:hypothetical protein